MATPTENSKIIPINLDFLDTLSLNGKVHNTKMSFWTKDVGSAFLEFETDASLIDVEVSIVLENLTDRSNIQKDITGVTSSPFYYQLGEEIANHGRWLAQITVKRGIEVVTSGAFAFSINKSVGDGTPLRLVSIDSINNVVSQIEVLKSSIQDYLDGLDVSEQERIELLTQYNETYEILLNDIESKELLREQSEIDRKQTFDDLVDSEMIAQNVETKLTEKEATFAPRLLSAEQQLADIELNKADIADLPSSAYTFRGSTTFAALPTTGNTLGDVYYTTDKIVNYAWTGTAWTPIGNGAFANGTVTNSKLADSAVTPEKTSFIDATNLFNQNDVQVGKTIGTNSQVESDSVRWLGGYVAVSAGEILSISTASYRLQYYNESRSPVGTRAGTAGGKFTVPNNLSIRFIRVSGQDSTLYDKIMFNRGGELLPFRPYGIIKKEHLPEDKGLLLGEVEPKHTNFFHIPKNLLNLNTVLIGKSVDVDGSIIDDPIRWLSDFIEVGYGDDVLSITKDTYRIGRYDKNFNFLSRGGITGSSLINLNILKDDPRKYIRISGTINPESIMLNRGSTLLPWESGAVVLKKQYMPSDLQIDTDQIVAQVREEMKGQLTQYQPSFPKLTFETVTTGWSIPKWLSADGEVIYGHYGKELLQSFDEWETLIRIGDPLDYEISGMRELGDGELLVSTLRYESINVKSKVFKTVGYNRNNPEATTFKEVLEVDSAQSNINNWWGFSVYENIVTISDYGLKGAEGAKNVWVSTDYGETFTMIFNQHLIGQQVDGAPPYTATAHMHTAAYDPYWNRIWVVVGDNPNTATYYSDDMGTSWTFVEGSSIVQYTGIMALPNAVLFGSDRNPNGVHVYHRGNKSEMPVIEPLLLVNDSKVITHVFQMPFKRDWNPATPTYFASEGISNAGGRTVIIGTVDGKTANLMFEGDLSGPYSGNMRCPLGPTAQGNIVIYMDDSSIDGYRTVKAKAPTWSRV